MAARGGSVVKGVMVASLAWATACGLLKPAAATSLEVPNYVSGAWRIRLAAMAEPCGLRDAVWAQRFAEGQRLFAYKDAPQETVLFAQVPKATARHEIDGAAEAFMSVGSVVATWHGGCEALAAARNFETADAIADGMKDAKQISAMPELPDYLATAQEHILATEMALACRIKPASWEEAAFASNHADAIDRTYAAMDQQGTAFPLEDYLSEEEGMVEATVYAARRVAEIFPGACKHVAGSAALKRADEVRKRYVANPDLFWKHIKKPED